MTSLLMMSSEIFENIFWNSPFKTWSFSDIFVYLTSFKHAFLRFWSSWFAEKLALVLIFEKFWPFFDTVCNYWYVYVIEINGES